MHGSLGGTTSWQAVSRKVTTFSFVAALSPGRSPREGRITSGPRMKVKSLHVADSVAPGVERGLDGGELGVPGVRLLPAESKW